MVEEAEDLGVGERAGQAAGRARQAEIMEAISQGHVVSKGEHEHELGLRRLRDPCAEEAGNRNWAVQGLWRLENPAFDRP
jgi:hypothetical protein